MEAKTIGKFITVLQKHQSQFPSRVLIGTGSYNVVLPEKKHVIETMHILHQVK